MTPVSFCIQVPWADDTLLLIQYFSYLAIELQARLFISLDFL